MSVYLKYILVMKYMSPLYLYCRHPCSIDVPGPLVTPPPSRDEDTAAALRPAHRRLLLPAQPALLLSMLPWRGGHDITWHSMTWHDMTWHDSVWLQACHCGPVSTLCSRTGYPDTGPDFVGCIRKDHARWPAALQHCSSWWRGWGNMATCLL